MASRASATEEAHTHGLVAEALDLVAEALDSVAEALDSVAEVLEATVFISIE